MRRFFRILFLIVMVILIAAWFVINPAGQFGLSCEGFTTYSMVPIPWFDVQVRTNGEWRTVKKNGAVTEESILWLMESKPQVLIIGRGYKANAPVEPAILERKDCEVKVLETKEALTTFNQLRAEQRRVAIHLRSTS